MPTTILEVNSLKLSLNPSFLADRPKEVLRSVSFKLERGKSLAILGQTASGKSLLLRSLSRFFHELPIREVDGAVLFEGKNLLRTSQSRLLSLRGSRIAHILQDAHALFNPRLTIRQHFDMILRVKQRKLDDPVEHTIRHLYRVGIVEPESLLLGRVYPEELDTSTRQKLMIASALVCEPHLLIADEPTAEFDSGAVARFVELLEQLKKESGLGTVSRCSTRASWWSAPRRRTCLIRANTTPPAPSSKALCLQDLGASGSWPTVSATNRKPLH